MANYTLDGTDLSYYGLQVKELRGVYTIPERKLPAETDNPITNGVLSLSGSNDFFVKEREIEIDCYMIATNPQDAVNKMGLLQTALYNSGTRTLSATYSSESWICYCRDGATTKRLTGVEGVQVIYQVVIKLIEINPRRTML
jgi:hypothetical protein